jgi:EAL and modified HD-GYP domain-containing signal transduction protein
VPPVFVSSRPAGKVFVARQPILDRSGRVFGYELLHRSDAQSDQFKPESADHATAHILTDGLLAIGLDALASGRHAFINVNRQFLLDGIPAVLPPGRVAFELGADVSGDDPDVLAVCQSLRQVGYALVIDHGGAVASPLMELATFIKVDFSTETTAAQRWKAFPDGPPAHAACIATHVETAEQLALAIAEGCTYFQGFYFGRPVIKEGSSVPPQKIAQLRLLTVLHDPDLTVMRLEEIIKPDPSMCYRVLRAVNSAGAALQTTVHSIREALVLLGCDTVRRWASLWALADAGQDAHAELVSMATVRARCCELLGASIGGEETAAEGFLIGMCSLLDAILGRSMRAVVSELPLPESVEAALLGVQNAQRHLLDAVVAYESGEWDQASALAQAAGADPAALASAYGDALRWAYELKRHK